MRKVINGLVYDTEKATLVAEQSNGLTYNDFNYVEEAIYITRNGRYFLHGKGGANTQYAKYGGNFSYGSEDIRALSNESVYSFLESWNEITAIETHFPNSLEEA